MCPTAFEACPGKVIRDKQANTLEGGGCSLTQDQLKQTKAGENRHPGVMQTILYSHFIHPSYTPWCYADNLIHPGTKAVENRCDADPGTLDVSLFHGTNFTNT